MCKLIVFLSAFIPNTRHWLLTRWFFWRLCLQKKTKEMDWNNIGHIVAQFTESVHIRFECVQRAGLVAAHTQCDADEVLRIMYVFQYLCLFTVHWSNHGYHFFPSPSQTLSPWEKWQRSGRQWGWQYIGDIENNKAIGREFRRRLRTGCASVQPHTVSIHLDNAKAFIIASGYSNIVSLLCLDYQTK